ncbi:1,3-beta-glucanosyltransferase Gel2 [Aspergillus luchuensis]|uniref:1,3-beta-glucanosyltransferase Gel2 n=1 Tax=Aspergillus kawachii TaxID=1069201 RepID=A0A146F524_ASPKA|nr:1,3-beta-glucanosyltransferase Gel2 [Aspergillus luchuensis]
MTIIDDGDAIKSHGHLEVSEAQSSSFSCSVTFQQVEGLLECLREFPLMEGSRSYYYIMSQAAVVPAPFVHRALAETPRFPLLA